MRLLKSFKHQIISALVFSILFVASAGNLFIYKYSFDVQFNYIRDKLMTIAKVASFAMDAETLMSVPMDRKGADTGAYKAIHGKLSKIKEAIPSIKYIYTMRKTDKPGIWQFIVDPTPPTETEKRRGYTSYPGDKYDASRFREMSKAFDGPQADRKLEVDEWGATLSGYAPVVDAGGNAVAMIGVDVEADKIYRMQKDLHIRTVIVLLAGVILSLIFGFYFSNMLIRPIKRLIEGTKQLGGGNLDYEVKPEGNLEIATLASEFNAMAGKLSESRKALNSYFYKVMQSLVRILEAKDHYTQGHSERVAEYVEKTARTIGISAEKMELIRDVALLHDIGKLGIKKEIIEKKGSLTDEEWDEIRKHPVIGEDMLNPIKLENQMTEIIRGHHEKYDGSGYPDNLKGDEIHEIAQIISVADAYDAMTSDRPYRRSMSREDAFRELRKNSGKQFNPEVVEIFIKSLGGG
ncbi:MAG: HD domain-containing protein [Candidatus Omnitrophica bacterium]|nr:HD domain-containing protein [Candidatus Omnitrophota bacterium]